MAIENRVFTTTHTFSDNQILYHRESFGWSLVSGTDEKMFFKRETTMPDYRHLKQYEALYEAALASYIKYDKGFKIHKVLFFLLLILTVVVGAVIYLLILFILNTIYKFKKRKFSKALNEAVENARKLRYASNTSGFLNY